MPVVSIVDTVPDHIRSIVGDLRKKDESEIRLLGFEPRRALFYCYRNAIYRKTGMIDNKPAAMWGAVGTPFSVVGRPYLITSNLVTRISPILFAKIYSREARVMKSLFPILENFVDANYDESIRLLSLAGFEIGDSVTLNDQKFLRFMMKDKD